MDTLQDSHPTHVVITDYTRPGAVELVNTAMVSGSVEGPTRDYRAPTGCSGNGFAAGVSVGRAPVNGQVVAGSGSGEVDLSGRL